MTSLIKTTVLPIGILLLACLLMNILSSAVVLGVVTWQDDTLTWDVIRADLSTIGIGRLGIGIVHLCTFVGGGLLWYGIMRKRWANFGTYFQLSRPPRTPLTWASVAVTLLLLPIMALVVQGLTHLGLPDFVETWDDGQTELLEGILTMHSIWDLLVLILVVAVLPAIGEELIFRGILQRHLITSLGPIAGILVASILFSAFHLQIMGFVPKLLLGLAFGFVYYQSQHLFYPMLMHFINNALPLWGLYLAGGQLPETAPDSDTNLKTLAPTAIICFTLLIFVLQYIIRLTQRDEAQP